MSDPSQSKQSQQQKQNQPNPSSSNENQPGLGETSKKKSRLQWDEENLISNAAEMERAGPRMKIDEPKTPYVGSETGSSTSGSAHQSPPESPSFIPGERLVGFKTLEQQHGASKASNASSDGFSSAGSGPRSVHISDEVFASSGGSSPHSSEGFVARRKAHYRNEAIAIRRFSHDDEDDDDDDDDDQDNDNDNENLDDDENQAQQPLSNGDRNTTSPGTGNVTSPLQPRSNGLIPNGDAHAESTGATPDENN